MPSLKLRKKYTLPGLVKLYPSTFMKGCKVLGLKIQLLLLRFWNDLSVLVAWKEFQVSLIIKTINVLPGTRI